VPLASTLPPEQRLSVEGNDVATAWQRAEDAELTEQLLRGLTGKMLDHAWFKVDKLAGEAHVALASLPTADFFEICDTQGSYEQ
jgi:hypothetical protein